MGFLIEFEGYNKNDIREFNSKIYEILEVLENAIFLDSIPIEYKREIVEVYNFLFEESIKEIQNYNKSKVFRKNNKRTLRRTKSKIIKNLYFD